MLKPLFNIFKNVHFNKKNLQQANLKIFLFVVSAQIFVTEAGHCNFDQFMCKNGKCIPQAKLCDGRLDCSDNSDEIGCDLKMCRKPDWFQCGLRHGPCLSSALICNGIENCPGGEDELDCVKEDNDSSKDFDDGGWHYSQRNCSQFEYTCSSDRSCIPINFMCDGRQDCHDGSDETTGCAAAEAQCKGFFCRNKRCLESKKWLCDGIDDCGDNSDEMDCADICTPEMGKFLCRNNITCLSLEQVCDAKMDCPDRSDESRRCTASNNCTTKTCPPASKCQMMPQSGPECICPKGFKHSLIDDICVDINECLEKYGACSQICVNLPGTYECLCHEGYSLREDNRTCEANGEEALLLYTTQVTIMGVNLRSMRVYTVAENLTKVIGVAYDGEHIYWTNIQNEGESIVKANLDGTEPDILLTSGLDAPEDLAVDWLTGNIYFSDNVMHHIAVCSNNGHFCTVLVTDDVHQPRGVALWPQRSQIFWTDWGLKPMIARASMDGTKSKPLVTEKIHWPNGIALDIYNDRVYWVDAKIATIESVRTDGTDRRMVLEEILKHPYGLAIFEDSIYWSDWGTKSIHSCNKFTGKDHKVIAKDRTIYAVHVYHSSKQKTIEHACERARCSHLCLLAENNSFSCACPDGMQLGPDQLRCIKTDKKQRLFLGVRSSLLEMEHTTFGRHSITTTHKLDMLIDELAYNSVNNSVFVADNYRKCICELDLQTNILKTLVKENVGNVTALAFDHLSHNLYWADSERHVVEVLSLQTRHRAMVSFFSGLERPIGLAIIPADGAMFVALKSRRYVHIDRKSLNGLDEHSHVFEDELGDGDIKLAADFETNTLYWADSDMGRISFSDYHKLHAYTFRGRLKRPSSLAIVDEDVFWSEEKSNTIHWTHKSNLGPLKRFDIEVNLEVYAAHVLPSHIPLTASSAFPNDDHPCQHRNGRCSHICVSLGKMRAGCLCPAGLVFGDATNRSCVDALDCEFHCRSGECLPMSRRCNNRKDCPDNSDEEGCEMELKQKPKVICSVGKFMCRNAEQCIKAVERCDGNKQCRDGSDEEHCENFDKAKFCHHHQHVCDNGRCVDFSVMCDGTNDCGDNSDELNCQVASGYNITSRPVCDKNMFQCNSGTCIAKSWECDGKIDCSDASDEHGKCGVRECPADMHRCLLGQCIDKLLVCDGHNDCGDLTDELNCDFMTGEKKKFSCGDERNPMYQCSSNPNICLELSAKCNGTAECPRGEDEADCGNMCSIYEFQCRTSKACIRAEFRCDKEKDCADGSDEENCARYDARNGHVEMYTHEKPCEPKTWNCRDGECVDESRVCDGVLDCETGADEGPLCKTACKPVNGKLPCDNKCKATPAGAVCSCFNGYKLGLDYRSCFDINECEEQDPCSQVCENTHGSYRCSCYPNFMMRPDKTTCKSIESEKSLLFSTYDEVRSMTEQPIILKIAWKANDSKINSFDLNTRTRQAFFTTDGENILYKVDVDKGQVNATLVVPMPGKLAVDWITDNVYVVSRSQVNEIQVCSFSARMCGTILKAKLHETIKTIAVDAYNRLLFFVVIQSETYGSHQSRIVSATLDGNKRETLVTKEESFITTLDFDPYKKVLYFTDMHQKMLQGIGYHTRSEGTPMTIMHKSLVLYPSGLAWYENQVFIVNLGSKEAVQCYLYGARKCKTFNLNILNAEDILVDGTSRQPMNRNPCDMAECRGMCIQTEFTYECMCGSLIVNENIPCDESNKINSTSFLKYHEYSSHEDQGSSHIELIIWILVILLLLLACGLGYIFYRRQQQDQRKFIRNLHFQNPLASFFPYGGKTDTMRSGLLSTGTGCSSATTTASFEVEREKIYIDSPNQKPLKKSTTLHGLQISLETTKPHEIYQMAMDKQLQRTERRFKPTPFSEDDGSDFERTIADDGDNARTSLVP